MNKILGVFKNFIYKADFFYTPQLLRVKEEPQYKTLFGGFVSLSIIIALLITFYNKVIQTLNMIIINSSFQNSNAEDPLPLILSTVQNGFFMFGIQVWHHNLNSGKRYFDIVLSNTHYETGTPTNQSVQYELEPCTKDHWRDYPRAQENFQRLYMHFWKCPPKDTQFLIHGKYASPTSQTLDVAIKKCTNSSFSDSRPCATQTQIQQFFTQNGNFYYTIYFLNPLINPESQDYLTYYLEDSNYIIFDNNGGEQGQLWVEDYKIVTDQSILPFSEIKQQSGGIITKNAIKNRYNNIDDVYATFFFFKSPNSKVINRTFQKIDQILSYIGGLFGTIAIVLFIVNAYNGYSFEIGMAGYLYKRENQDENIFKKYNFLYFLGHLIYGILSSFNFKPNWPRFKRYHECREEMLKQFDILFLYKRINFLQKTISCMTEEYQLKGLHLVSQLTLDQAKEIRKSYKLKLRLFQQIKSLYKNETLNSTEHLMNKVKSKLNTNKINNNNVSLDQDLQNSQNDLNLKRNINKNNQKVFDVLMINPNDLNSELQSHFKGSYTHLLRDQTRQIIQEDMYSSQEQDSDDENHDKESFIIESIRMLKKDKIKNKLSSRIWTNIEPKITQLLQPILQNVIESNQLVKDLRKSNSSDLVFDYLQVNNKRKDQNLNNDNDNEMNERTFSPLNFEKGENKKIKRLKKIKQTTENQGQEE